VRGVRESVLSTVAAAGSRADTHRRAAVRLPAVSEGVRRPVQPASAPADARGRQEVRLLALRQDLLTTVAARQAHARCRLSSTGATPWIWIWINNRQNLRWSITSMSVHRCLWHGAQLRLECRYTVCIHCQLGQRVPLWDGSYKEGVLVLLSIG